MSTISRSALVQPNLRQWVTAIVSTYVACSRSQTFVDKPHVLLIDGQSAIRELVSLYLGQSGFEVATAINAREARPLVERGGVDVVILDWTQDGGEELLRLSRTQRPHLPVVVFSAHPAAPGVAALADAVVQKGRPLDGLSAAVSHTLKQHQKKVAQAA